MLKPFRDLSKKFGLLERSFRHGRYNCILHEQTNILMTNKFLKQISTFHFFWHFERQFSGILWKRHAEEHLEWNFFLKVLNLFFFQTYIGECFDFWKPLFCTVLKLHLRIRSMIIIILLNKVQLFYRFFRDLGEKLSDSAENFRHVCWNLILRAPRINLNRNIFFERT